MGSSSKASSSSSSNEVTDSYNTTLTNSLTGNGNLGLNLGSSSDLSGNFNYGYDSNNYTDDRQIALGAGSSTNGDSSIGTTPDASTAGNASGIDWSEVIVYVIGGIVLVFVLRLLGDKHA
jgi:hypothetical protein